MRPERNFESEEAFNKEPYLRPIVNVVIITALAIAALASTAETMRVAEGDFGKSTIKHSPEIQRQLPGYTEDAFWIGADAGALVIAVGSALAKRELKRSGII